MNGAERKASASELDQVAIVLVTNKHSVLSLQYRPPGLVQPAFSHVSVWQWLRERLVPPVSSWLQTAVSPSGLTEHERSLGSYEFCIIRAELSDRPF